MNVNPKYLWNDSHDMVIPGKSDPKKLQDQVKFDEKKKLFRNHGQKSKKQWKIRFFQLSTVISK